MIDAQMVQELRGLISLLITRLDEYAPDAFEIKAVREFYAKYGIEEDNGPNEPWPPHILHGLDEARKQLGLT